ncbi:pyruvate kinase [Sphingomonas corticis]|jgi:pyruvate kinase|uniref:Pyruvate kinase n=1 Tax=Sphingomonas corticis TaxID=2722791 RepID=A0ABX1CQP3_9SPHN|nr:pyruvate kinase [Sphingomonas corticis]NJR78993.1 pyruvate kinase [Sphingomonas corticis]
MTDNTIAPRSRKVRVLATLGPASNTPEMIRTLFQAGADAFRINMSHGDQASKGEIVQAIRGMEREFGRPTTILADLQGPKLRVGRFAGGRVELTHGSTFVLDQDETPGDATRVRLPHREIFEAIEPGARLLLDDGKLVLRVTEHDADRIETLVEVGGPLSDNKGLNVPDVVVPMAALTQKDRSDLAFAIDAGVDWIALSFVQRPEDLWEARKLIGGKAALLAKIEKPAAIERLEEIVEACDGVMVARGDLGVELPPQSVPPLQKRIVETARRMGRPVVVATQMLESMIQSPSPTRAEVSDVATAIYDGADAIMLSAESAAGAWPVESVAMMNAIGDAVERDPAHGDRIHFTVTRPDPTTADALAEAAKNIAATVSASAIICYTSSGSTARRIARERPAVPILVLTPKLETARRLGLLWGTHNVHTRDVDAFEEMVAKAKRMALRQNVAKAGDVVVVMAGVPFRTPGSTNVLHVVRIVGDELKGYKGQAEG